MKPSCNVLRPNLARGVRYRWDQVRSQHQLLFPEGLWVLNDTAAAIVRLCDGRTVESICSDLAQAFPAARVQDDVDAFLRQLARRGLLCHDVDD